MSRLRQLALPGLFCAAFAGSPGQAAASGAPEARGPLASAAEPLVSAGVDASVSRAPGAGLGAAPRDTARVRWRFRSASPVTGSPAVSSDGFVYVASVEGYVHALGSDGSFRWSYGLRGIPIGSPAVDDAGRVYVATREGRLYVLSVDGQLDSASSVHGRPRGAPLWADGAVYLVAGERLIYATPGAGAPGSSGLGAPASAAPASVGAGLIAVGTSEAALIYRRSRVVARIELRAPLVQPLLGGDERWFALTSDGLSAFDASSHALLWSAPARRAALSADQRSLVVEADRELRWLSPLTGEVLGRAPLLGDVSAAPAVTNSGVVLLPMVGGQLRLVDPLGPLDPSKPGALSGEAGAVEIGVVDVGRAPLWAPVHDEARASVVLAAGGSVLACDLAGTADPLESVDAGGGA